MSTSMEMREIIKNPLDAEDWRRSGHVLNILTFGEYLTIKGEEMQNPYYLSVGCGIILETITPKFREKDVEQWEEEGKKRQKTTEFRGRQTKKYREYFSTLSQAKNLITAGISRQYENSHTCLQRAYGLLWNLKIDLLQEVEDMGFNFKASKNPSNAYLTTAY